MVNAAWEQQKTSKAWIQQSKHLAEVYCENNLIYLTWYDTIALQLAHNFYWYYMADMIKKVHHR